MYRNDVFERIAYIMKNRTEEDDIRPNFARLRKSLGCDYRTFKAAYEKRRKGKETGRSIQKAWPKPCSYIISMVKESVSEVVRIK